MDVAIIDIPWNGAWEGIKVAAMAEGYEVNCAPHNFYGHLSTVMSAHFCAAIPNFRVMEIDIDDVPWKDDLVTVVPEIEDGHLVVPTGPGWGTELERRRDPRPSSAPPALTPLDNGRACRDGDAIRSWLITLRLLAFAPNLRSVDRHLPEPHEGPASALRAGPPAIGYHRTSYRASVSILAGLDVAEWPSNLDLPGYWLHPLRDRPGPPVESLP